MELAIIVVWMAFTISPVLGLMAAMGFIVIVFIGHSDPSLADECPRPSIFRRVRRWATASLLMWPTSG
jgi:hypothetical protein